MVAAALTNALKVTGKKKGAIKIVINGAGSAGISIARLLLRMHFGNIVLCDIGGALCPGEPNMNPAQAEMAAVTNLHRERGSLADVMKGADVFIGVSRPGLVTRDMVASMKGGIVFPLANPTPEIMPDEAKAGGAAVVGTGRSDYPNQINNVLVFPGIFKGALRVRARAITESMKVRAAEAIASVIPDAELNPENIIPSALDKRVAEVVADAVAAVAEEEGLSRC